MGILISLNILIPIVLVIIILGVIMWILYSKNKDLYKKITFEKNKFLVYKKDVDNLKNTLQNPEKDFEKLNQIARNFFKEYYNMDLSLTYLELEKIFKQKNRKEYADFCKLMSDTNYSGKKTTSKDINQLINSFTQMIKEYETL